MQGGWAPFIFTCAPRVPNSPGVHGIKTVGQRWLAAECRWGHSLAGSRYHGAKNVPVVFASACHMRGSQAHYYIIRPRCRPAGKCPGPPVGRPARFTHGRILWRDQDVPRVLLGPMGSATFGLLSVPRGSTCSGNLESCDPTPVPAGRREYNTPALPPIIPPGLQGRQCGGPSCPVWPAAGGSKCASAGAAWPPCGEWRRPGRGSRRMVPAGAAGHEWRGLAAGASSRRAIYVSILCFPCAGTAAAIIIF